MIEFRSVSKEYSGKKGKHVALRDITLTIPKGSITGIIGESGAGKSTLLRCVNLLERPTSGSVRINGEDLTALSHNELVKARRNIGMIFQHFNLLSSRTVAQNIAFPLELEKYSVHQITQRVEKLLTLVGLEDKRDEYPASLSGGQKQRVAIARALANHPPVLLCDEATSALDPLTTRSILALLKQINQQFTITILLVTHEMDVLKEICDEVIVLQDGELTQQGSINQILSPFEI